MIKGIHHVQITIPSGEEERDRDFYCEICGLKEIPKPQSLLAKGGFWLKLGEIEIHVSIQDKINRQELKSHICFECHGLLDWREKIEAMGVSIDENDSIPGVDRFMVRDPFGNRLEFLEKIGL